MNTPSSYDDSLLYVHIDNWEYQCCGTVPRVGAELSGTLSAYAAESSGYLAPHPAHVDRRTGLVAFGGIVAQLGTDVTDPHGDLILVLSWHQDDNRPRVSGVVERVVEMRGRFLPIADDRTLRIAPDSYTYHVVDEAPRWPEEDLVDGGRAALGAVVGLRVVGVTVPTQEEIEARLVREERLRRTMQVIVPATMFAKRPPRSGNRMELDLGDPAVRALGDHADSSDVVRGEIGAVTPLPEIPEESGWVALTPLTEHETANYLIDLVRDQE